ncbi:hypothetical protein PsyrH_10960 [Pseudomonas syringae pv. syringae HS191]|nr:hypothetical protein PsyrH_10960 [Pseudomonas syringae pv. syringae HS191]SDS74497.1 hypothetical protein SAMN05421724_2098 [Pseudomonas syringae]
MDARLRLALDFSLCKEWSRGPPQAPACISVTISASDKKGQHRINPPVFANIENYI